MRVDVLVAAAHGEYVFEPVPTHDAPERSQRLLDFVHEIGVDRHIENLLGAVLFDKGTGKPFCHGWSRHNKR